EPLMKQRYVVKPRICAIGPSSRRTHTIRRVFLTLVVGLSLAMNLSCTAAKSLLSGSDQAPGIRSFVAMPAIIETGQSTVLSWNVVGASNLTISFPGGTINSENSVAISPTSVSITPTATTAYTLTASNSTGTATATITVEVV